MFLLHYGTVECAVAAALGVDDAGLTGDKLDLEPVAVARIVDIPSDAATGRDTVVSISGGGTLDSAAPRGLYYSEGRHIADSQTNDGEEGDDPRLNLYGVFDVNEELFRFGQGIVRRRFPDYAREVENGSDGHRQMPALIGVACFPQVGALLQT